MAYVRAKKINNKDVYYLVESHRDGGKVRQKVLAYLGECDTVGGAIGELQGRLERFRGYAAKARYRAENPVGWREYRKRASTLAWAEKLERKVAELEQRIEALRRFL